MTRTGDGTSDMVSPQSVIIPLVPHLYIVDWHTFVAMSLMAEREDVDCSFAKGILTPIVFVNDACRIVILFHQSQIYRNGSSTSRHIGVGRNGERRIDKEE